MLRAIVTLSDQLLVPPTLREICAELGFTSTNGVSEYIDKLVARGLVTKLDYRSARGLVVIGAGRSEAA